MFLWRQEAGACRASTHSVRRSLYGDVYPACLRSNPRGEAGVLLGPYLRHPEGFLACPGKVLEGSWARIIFSDPEPCVVRERCQVVAAACKYVVSVSVASVTCSVSLRCSGGRGLSPCVINRAGTAPLAASSEPQVLLQQQQRCSATRKSVLVASASNLLTMARAVCFVVNQT